MKLTEFLVPDNIHYGIFLSSKKRALEVIGKFVADYLNQNSENAENEDPLCPVACFSNLFKREKLGTTALNNGIALPHSKLPECAHLSIEKPIAIFLRLEEPIDFDAEDHKEVDLIYAILFPEQNCESYRSALTELSQKLSDKNLLKQLRAAESAEDIWHIFSYADQHIEQEQE